jgi:hypothetical protein
MTMHVAPTRPLEHAAHRLGVALITWSDRRAVRSVTDTSRSAQRLAFAEQSALEARHRSWERLAAGAPRLR